MVMRVRRATEDASRSEPSSVATPRRTEGRTSVGARTGDTPPPPRDKEAHHDETVGSRNGRVRDLAGGSGMACKPEERT